jgi:hypothetical protein
MVHNGYLQWAVTNGLPGLALYLALVSSILFLLWRTERRPPARAPDPATARELMIEWAFIGSIVGYLTQDLSGWEEISLSAFFWVILGASVAFCTSASPARRWNPGQAWRLVVSLSAAAACFALTALAFVTLREMRADGLFFQLQALDVTRDWPRIQAERGAALVPDNPYYQDAAGVVSEPTARVRDREVQRAATLLSVREEECVRPIHLIHRMDLVTAALQKGRRRSIRECHCAVASVTQMDRNNATVHEAVAKFRLAEEEQGCARVDPRGEG